MVADVETMTSERRLGFRQRAKCMNPRAVESFSVLRQNWRLRKVYSCCHGGNIRSVDPFVGTTVKCRRRGLHPVVVCRRVGHHAVERRVVVDGFIDEGGRVQFLLLRVDDGACPAEIFGCQGQTMLTFSTVGRHGISRTKSCGLVLLECMVMKFCFLLLSPFPVKKSGFIKKSCTE